MDKHEHDEIAQAFGRATTLSEINEIAASYLNKLDPRPTHDIFLRVAVVTDFPEELAKSLAKVLVGLPHVVSASEDGWDELSYPNLTGE